MSGFICHLPSEPQATLGFCSQYGAPYKCDDNDGDNAFEGAQCVDQLLDCDDTTASVSPLASEVCDGVDNDCDDAIDEDLVPVPCPLQAGVCRGSRVSCSDGALANCATAGLYGPDFELTEVTCDGLDNDCDGRADEDCECRPNVDIAVDCGTDTGACTRGVRFCQPDGSLSQCIAAAPGRICADGEGCETDGDCADGSECTLERCEFDADCALGGFCVSEQLEVPEDLFDDCADETDPGCQRRVCRHLVGTAECASVDDCGQHALCLDGLCEPLATDRLAEVAEVCNGIDDDCDGQIDNDADRREICGPCPFNMAFLPVSTPTGQDEFVCMDWYEAARPDATADHAGVLEHHAISAPGVLPWTKVTADVAEAACRAEAYRDLAPSSALPIVTRRLCKTYEWHQGCGGKRDTTNHVRYPYTLPGTEEVFVLGACVDGSTGSDSPSATGSAPECCKGSVCDAVGNVAEWVIGAGDAPMVAGGSFRDTDPDTLSCGDGLSYLPPPDDPATADEIGFRCCVPAR